MQGTARAGLVYFLAVFAVGFALGTLRYLLVAPAIGEFAAVAAELPMMLGVSVLVCRAILRRYKVPSGLWPRLAMGATAFALVMIAEAALAMFGFGRTLAVHLRDFATPAGLLGLGGQLLFAALPVLMRSAAPVSQPSRE